MDKGSTTLELSRSLVLPRTREDIPIITMEAILTMEGVHTTIVALRMGMGMEETTVRAVPTPYTRQEGSESRYLLQVRKNWTLRQ